MKRVHNFIVKDPKACSVFLSQSSQSAGVDATLKLTRLLLISLFLCYEGAELNSSSSLTNSTSKSTKKGNSRKRGADEMSGGETITEQPGDGFEANVIPAGDREFQKSLLHIITVLTQRLRSVCSSEELVEGSRYLLSDLTVIDDNYMNDRVIDYWSCMVIVLKSMMRMICYHSSPSLSINKLNV